jgi:phosphate/sulfate permease
MADIATAAWLFSIVGFLIAAYSIVANDAIQTLGTFLSSNAKRPWWILWLYACSIIVAVMLWGYFAGDQDIAFGRLNQLPYPEAGVQWWHAIPPLFLLILTRYGIPVSTTFLVLTIFALTGGAETEGVLPKMLTKSALGYIVAIGAAFTVYLLISRTFERWVHRTLDTPHKPVWFVLQWASTAFLWSQWLMQDLANIFVFLPRQTSLVPVMENGVPLMQDGTAVMQTQVAFSPLLLVFATVVMLALHAIIFATRGGEIQKIVLSKTNTTDIRAATLVDLIYGIILFIFKEMNDIPMSTTWVFLGMLAGREIAVSYIAGLRSKMAALWDVASDVIRALIGLVISVFLAILLPAFARGELDALLSDIPGYVGHALGL